MEMKWSLLTSVTLSCLAFLMNGCGESEAAKKTTTISTSTLTTTTTLLSAGFVEVFERHNIQQDGGGNSNSRTGFGKNFLAGKPLPITDSDLDLLSLDCQADGGVCAFLTLSNFSHGKAHVHLQPTESGQDALLSVCNASVAHDGLNTSWGNSKVTLCSSLRNVTCVRSTILNSRNIWFPDFNRTKAQILCEGDDPRVRQYQDYRWRVPDTPVCPSQSGACSLDPLCSCPDDAVKTAIFGGDAYADDLSYGADSGAWCWRCDVATGRTCATYTARPDGTQYPDYKRSDSCTQSNCNCPNQQNSTWPWYVFKRTWYFDRHSLPTDNRNASSCYTCGGEGVFYRRLPKVEYMEFGVDIYVEHADGVRVDSSNISI